MVALHGIMQCTITFASKNGLVGKQKKRTIKNGQWSKTA